MRAVILAALLAAACGRPEPEQAEVAAPVDNSLNDKALAVLEQEPKVLAVRYEPNINQVQWTLTMKDDGTRRDGFAMYACEVLREQRATEDYQRVGVSIVDESTGPLGFHDCNA